MLLKLYSVYDWKTKTYSPPMCCHNDEHAMRFFTGVFMDQSHMASKYPEDFKLQYIGDYDDATGEIIPTATKFLCDAETLISAYKARQEKRNLPIVEK